MNIVLTKLMYVVALGISNKCWTGFINCYTYLAYQTYSSLL